MEKIDIKEIVAENARRRAALEASEGGYDPLRGIGAWGDRVDAGGCRVPRATVARMGVDGYMAMDKTARERLRIKEDFEFWCARCVTIKHKLGGAGPFVPNRPQRRLIAAMERQRAAGLPIRIILLKARQWGGTTLVLVYMAWMQLVRHVMFNGLLLGHQRMNSHNIKRMLELLVERYPREMVEPGDEVPRLSGAGAPGVYRLTPSGGIVVLGSALSEDAARGYDLSMAHLSEVAFWKDSDLHSPEDVVRTVSGTVPMAADTVVVMESTANGTGNLFHTEWERAVRGESDKTPVFVPWYEIALYRDNAVDDAAALWAAMDDYERDLWHSGLTLEMIAWYHRKRREYTAHSLMMAEYPTTAVEAFTSTDRCAFSMEDLERLREGCRAPRAVGEVVPAAGRDGWKRPRWVTGDKGLTQLWQQPERGHSYVVAVDIGGLGGDSDWSVIVVMDSDRPHGARPEVVAQWRGHVPHDVLAWKAVAMAQFYNQGLLVIESNTLDTSGTEGADGALLLNAIGRSYKNLYRRDGGGIGFHTNIRSKSRVIYMLKERVHLGTVVERDAAAVDEMSAYQEMEAGTRWEAAKGQHDDMVMTRAIALYAIGEMKSARAADNDIDVLKD